MARQIAAAGRATTGLGFAAILTLTGCFGDAGPEPTAYGLESRASGWASDWDEDATLNKVACVEGPYRSWMDRVIDFDHSGPVEPGLEDPNRGGTVWVRAREDPIVGDGRCQVWAYQYRSGRIHETNIVALDAKGAMILKTVNNDAAISFDYSRLHALSWPIDSDDAVRDAKHLDPAFESATSVVLVLKGESGAAPSWSVTRGNPTEEGTVHVE